MKKENKDLMVPIHFDDMFWQIQAKLLEEKNGDEPIIELSWGWCAGMTDEEIKEELDGDSPTHTEKVRILLSGAKWLRDQLDYIIKENEK